MGGTNGSCYGVKRSRLKNLFFAAYPSLCEMLRWVMKLRRMQTLFFNESFAHLVK